jgi:hypothetical protein
MPDPSSTGITATSTLSTSLASSRDRNSSPPPNNQMSLPGFAFNSTTICRGSWFVMRTPGYADGGSVCEKTTTSSPRI